MMIKKYILFLIFCVSQLLAGAQYSGLFFLNLNQNSNRLQGKLTGRVYYLNPKNSLKFFLQPDWSNGKIVLTDGDVFENVKMRYMAYGDELIAYNDNSRSLFIVDKNKVKEFYFNDLLANGETKIRKFINLDSLHTSMGRSYFEELYSGSVNLLVFYLIQEIKVNPYIDTTGKMNDKDYFRRNVYYIFSEAKGLERIQLKNRSIYSLYPEKKKEIRKLLRKNKVHVNNEDSAIRAFQLLDNSSVLN